MASLKQRDAKSGELMTLKYRHVANGAEKENGRPQGDYNRNSDDKRKVKQSANAIKIDAGFMIAGDSQGAIKVIEVVEYYDEEATSDSIDVSAIILMLHE